MTPEILAQELVNRVNKTKGYDDRLWSLINSVAAGIVTNERNGELYIREKSGMALSDFECFNAGLKKYGLEISKKGFKTFLRKTKTCMRRLVKEELAKDPVDFNDAMKKVILYEPFEFKYKGIYERAYTIYQVICSAIVEWQDAAMIIAGEVNGYMNIKN